MNSGVPLTFSVGSHLIEWATSIVSIILSLSILAVVRLDVLLPAGKLVIIPNGVPDLACPPAKALAFSLPAGTDPDLVIGTSCRILPEKRLEFLIDVMAELNHRLAGATLIVVGAAELRHAAYWQSLYDHMRSRNVANIYFVGRQADVVPFLQRMRVFVMISDHHGCPNASLEAMSLGLPIVANPAGGTAEQVEHGVNGFLVSDKDPRDMAHRVRTLLTNPETRRVFGEKSRSIAGERFSMERMVERYLTLLGLETGERATMCGGHRAKDRNEV